MIEDLTREIREMRESMDRLTDCIGQEMVEKLCEAAETMASAAETLENVNWPAPNAPDMNRPAVAEIGAQSIVLTLYDGSVVQGPPANFTVGQHTIRVSGFYTWSGITGPHQDEMVFEIGAVMASTTVRKSIGLAAA